jgi:cytidylate kinase
MNVVEAYIKFKGQLIIFISGLPACGKLRLAKTIQKDFKLKLINQYDYYKKDYDETTKLPDGTVLINWYTDRAIDWNKFNIDIEGAKGEGIIVVGFSLPDHMMTSKPDYHIHLNMPKQLCIEKRAKYVTKHKDKHPEEYKLVGTPTEKLKMNQLIFPYYLASRKQSKINKFINIGDMKAAEIYNIAFDSLINFIEDFLYPQDEEEKKIIKTPKVTDVTKTTEKKRKTETDSISVSGELLDEPQYSYDKELDMITEHSEPDDYEDDEGPIAFVPVNDPNDWSA